VQVQVLASSLVQPLASSLVLALAQRTQIL
jgi:hypothetical protein